MTTNISPSLPRSTDAVSALAVTGILIALALLTQLQAREALLMGITAMIATANWLWAKRREISTPKVSDGVVAAGVSHRTSNIYFSFEYLMVICSCGANRSLMKTSS
jgi:hypothetical protein